MRLAWILTVTAAALMGASALLIVRPHPPETVNAPVPREDTCGPRCLWIAAGRLGQPLPARQIEELFRDGTARGTTLAELNAAVTRLGIASELTKTGWNALREKPSLAILFVSDNHFVVADSTVSAPAGQDAIRIFEPDRLGVWMTRAELQRIWNGDSLLLFTKPSQRTDHPRAAPARCFDDVGLIRDSRKVHFQFPVRNTGSSPLKLRVANTSCSCTSATLSQVTVEPGDQSVLEAVVNLERKEGPFQEVVFLDSNDPERPQLRFDLKGGVYRSRILSTQRAHLGRIAPGSRHRFCIGVYDLGERKLNVGDIRALRFQGPSSTARRPGFTLRKLVREEIPEWDRQELKLSSHDTLIEVLVSTPADCESGPFEIEFSIATNLTEAPTLSLLIEGVVIPDLVSEPAAIVLTPRRGQSGVQEVVTIRSLSRRPLPGIADHFHSDIPATLASVTMDSDSAKRTVTFEPQTSSRQGRLTCRTTDGRTVEIPVLLSVADRDDQPQNAP